jgi:4-hydroxy-tetrahydrodipicolinate synthase
MNKPLRGSMVALVTPFKNGAVDESALKQLIDRQIASKTAALVPCGTTGESATLSHEEHEHVIELTIQSARGRVPVIAGTGSNNTQEAIRLTEHAKRAGADAALIISPYYNKPTQEGLYRHFRAIADAVDIPIVLYNIQSRTAVNIEPETFKRLVDDCPNIVAVKEASGSLEQMSQIRRLTEGRLTLISGDDALTLPVLAIGGVGVISVVANLVPRDVADMIDGFAAGKQAEALALHEKLLPLVKALFIETNPIPVKAALALLGLADPAVRLPLCSLSAGAEAKLKQALRDYGLLDSQGKPTERARTAVGC